MTRPAQRQIHALITDGKRIVGAQDSNLLPLIELHCEATPVTNQVSSHVEQTLGLRIPPATWVAIEAAHHPWLAGRMEGTVLAAMLPAGANVPETHWQEAHPGMD